MSQRYLDYDAPPRPFVPAANATATSILAAEAIAPLAGTLRGRVFEFIRGQGERGATREEISDGLGMKLHTVCGRCNELLGGKNKTLPQLIYQTAETRPTSSGCKAKVLKARVWE